MKFLNLPSLFMFSFFCISCVTSQTLKYTSEPRGATITVNGITKQEPIVVRLPVTEEDRVNQTIKIPNAKAVWISGATKTLKSKKIRLLNIEQQLAGVTSTDITLVRPQGAPNRTKDLKYELEVKKVRLAQLQAAQANHLAKMQIQAQRDLAQAQREQAYYNAYTQAKTLNALNANTRAIRNNSQQQSWNNYMNTIIPSKIDVRHSGHVRHTGNFNISNY